MLGSSDRVKGFSDGALRFQIAYLDSCLKCIGRTGQKPGDGDIGGEGEPDERQHACCKGELGLAYGDDIEEGEGGGISLSILRGGCSAGLVTATGFTVCGANAEDRPDPPNPALGWVARLAAFNAQKSKGSEAGTPSSGDSGSS